MTVIGKTSHALFFNGVSDGVVVPSSAFANTGTPGISGKSYGSAIGDSQTNSEHVSSAKVSKAFTIEAWVIPDCGGVIASKKGLFELSIGNVGTPGPAQFTVEVHDDETGRQSITVSSASPHITAGNHDGWDGIVYPSHSNELFGTFNQYNGALNTPIATNNNNRPLLHVVGIFTGQQVKLYVNGELVASEKLDKPSRLAVSTANLYIGGKGGEYRGVIEGVHWRRGYNESGIRPLPLISSGDTIGLWRFEEPVEVPQIVMPLRTNLNINDMVIAVRTEYVKPLVEYLTGKTAPTTNTVYDLTTDPYSNGTYETRYPTPIKHTPLNIIMNPTATSARTGLPYTTSPPERMRLLSITYNAASSTSTLGVSSIHLGDNGALRGVLHAHAQDDCQMVVINSDSVLDISTGKPYLAPNLGTQVIDRTGQMVVDEVNGNHGFIFSREIARGGVKNPYGFGGTFEEEGHKAGHTGRHMFSHVTGHPYLRVLPPAVEEVVNRNLDGDSDTFAAYFDGGSMGLREQLPIGTILDMHRQAYIGSALTTESSSTPTQLKENGMAHIDPTQRQIIGIGGIGFNPLPFLLKGHASINEDGTYDSYNIHLTPEDESRVAILETRGACPFPYVEMHYNAIDLTGNTLDNAAMGIISGAYAAPNLPLTADMVQTFGADTQQLDAYYIMCNGVRAADSLSTDTATIDYAGNRLVFSGGITAPFIAQLAVNGLVTYDLAGATLCITKTVPSGEQIIGGKTVSQWIHESLNAGTTLHSPGGVIRLSDEDLGLGSIAFEPHRLVGDNTGGTSYELELDTANLANDYLPQNPSDSPITLPQGIIASHVTDADHESRYHKLIVRPSQSGSSESATAQSTDPPVESAPSTFTMSPIQEATSNASGVFDKSPSNQSSNLYELFDIIDNWQDNKEHILIIQPTNKSRTMQLANFIGKTQNPANHLFVSIEYMQCRGKLSEFKDGKTSSGRTLILKGDGLVHDIRSSMTNYQGDGSPDSHAIKEITPGGPVVTVSLGGAGQGAKDTKPTYDPSPLARIGWNTRRPCGATISYSNLSPASNPATISVIPLNNNSASLASWGHICFPPSSGSSGNPTARIYLPSGASAAYWHIVGGVFQFDQTDTNTANRWFLGANGEAFETFADWFSAVGLNTGSLIVSDPLIGDESQCADGTTVNDRMFQSMDSVQHDYQLGTQYASTRALVEIPLFPDQFFENRETRTFPGPDNSMKITLDATMTAHTYAPNPVGIRLGSFKPAGDTVALGPYSHSFTKQVMRTTLTHSAYKVQNLTPTPAYGSAQTSTLVLYVENPDIFPDAKARGADNTSVQGTLGMRKVMLDNGEWAYYYNVDRVNKFLVIALGDGAMSDEFIASLESGTGISPIGTEPYQSGTPLLADGFGISSAEGQEFRSMNHYDRANVQTQGGNIDYGLKQYASAVEFKSGPRENPHLLKMENGLWNGKVVDFESTISTVIVGNAESFPRWGASAQWGNMQPIASGGKLCWKIKNTRTGLLLHGVSFPMTPSSFDPEEEKQTIIQIHKWANGAVPTYGAGNEIQEYDELEIIGLGIPGYLHTANGLDRMYPACLNDKWNYPYAQGGLRVGDTVWMNMHYTNPHAIDGMFCKSRGVLNPLEVHTMFNGGRGNFGLKPRESIPMENFLIGNNCRETAENFAQHVNQTILLNVAQLGEQSGRTVAFIDPYLCTDDHARVVLYDVGHNREFIAFHDIHMQVQSDPDAVEIKNMDVANGHHSQQRHKIPIDFTGVAGGSIDNATYPNYGSPTVRIRSPTMRSTYTEGAYSHDDASLLMIDGTDSSDPLANAMNYWMLKNTDNRNYYESFVLNADRRAIRTEDASVSLSHSPFAFANGIYNSYYANDFVLHYSSKWMQSLKWEGVPDISTWHSPSSKLESHRISQTTFDTPHGTRVIPAYLCLKGIRATPNPSSLIVRGSGADQHIYTSTEWKDMDFTRRLTIDLGEVGIKEGITNIEAAAKEIVRLVNQAGAKNGRSNIRKPNSQFPAITVDNNDASNPHIKADYAVTGSTFDPAPFWHKDADVSFDRGSHMGYLRAHIGRVVEDSKGNSGYSIIIHSTIPGATGRNFCAWLDNSKGQSVYSPQFLIGHGGRFRDYYCQPDELWNECMHPAPMPIDKHGKPFAPITTLHELVATTKPARGIATNGDSVPPAEFENEGEVSLEDTCISGGGASSNTIETESTTPNEQSVIQGLRKGTGAIGRINFGGLTATGIPGWSPDLGKWGFGESGKNTRAHEIYTATHTDISETTAHVPNNEKYDFIQDDIYAVELEDHRGIKHRIRILYKEYGQEFADERTTLPSTLDNEIVIWINDKDVSQGGFTIGKHMKGKGDIGGRIVTGEECITPAGALEAALEVNRIIQGVSNEPYCGSRWNTVKAPVAAYAVTLDRPAATTGTLQLSVGTTTGSFAHQNRGIWHDIPNEVDALGFMGFPKTNGIIQITTPLDSAKHRVGKTGQFISYESRTTYERIPSGAGARHAFFGCKNIPSELVSWATAQIGPVANTDRLAPVCISPSPNWTCLVTDELIAAAVAHAINLDDPNADNSIFDCREMYASDGKTFGDWGIAGDAIHVQYFKPENENVPLNRLFRAELHRDYGILEAHMRGDKRATGFRATNLGWGSPATSYTQPVGMKQAGTEQVGAHNAMIDKGLTVPCGYIPKTVLNVHTTYTGTNANKPSPRIVNSANEPINTNDWERNLKGLKKRAIKGDLISPNISNPSTIMGRPNNGEDATEKWSIHCWPFDTTVTYHGLHQAFQFGPIGRLKTERSGTSASPGPSVQFATVSGGGATELSEDVSYVPPHTIWSEGHYHKLWPYALDLGVGGTNRGSAGTMMNQQHQHAFARIMSINEVDEEQPTLKTTNESSNFQTFAHVGKFQSAVVVTPGSGYAAGNYRLVDKDDKFVAEVTITVGGSGEVTGVVAPPIALGINTRLNTSLKITGGGNNAAVRVTLVSDNGRNWIAQKFPYNKQFEGNRYAASSLSAKPILYFRGAKDGIDHTVPLYFGGGFSGAVFDINDGTQNDYTDMYTHPYSAGPTGSAGIQNAGEIMGSHAILDTTAILAMFPGTPYLDQHKGQAVSPFHNKDIVLPSDMAASNGAVPIVSNNQTYTDGTSNGTIYQKQPSPVVLRFAYPFARYDDITSNHQTTYVIFGPGQSVPHMFQPEKGDGSLPTLYEPSVAVSLSALWSRDLGEPTLYPTSSGIIPGYPNGSMTAGVYCYMGTPAYAYLPNDPSIGTNATWTTPHSTVSNYGWADPTTGFLSRTKGFLAGNHVEWQHHDGWEPAQGDPNKWYYNQEANYGLHLNDHFARNDAAENYNPTRSLPHSAPALAPVLWSIASTGYAHPHNPIPQSWFSASFNQVTANAFDVRIGIASDHIFDTKEINLKDFASHMDGGFLPGANFLDDRVQRNPIHFGTRTMPWVEQIDISTGGTIRVGDNASMYRIAAPLLNQLPGVPSSGTWALTEDDWGAGTLGHADRDVIVVDATRVQNAEELATVIASAVNEYPGHAGLKALGGTFLPSFQHAHKQDKTAWAKLPVDATAGAPGTSGLNDRPDHLNYMFGGINGIDATTGGHWTGMPETTSMTIAMGPTAGHWIPPSLPFVGHGRIWSREPISSLGWLSEYTAGGDYSAMSGIDRNAGPTPYAAANMGLYFFYNGVSSHLDVDTVASGANRSFYLGVNHRTGLRTLENPTLDCGVQQALQGGVAQGLTFPGGRFLDCAIMQIDPASVEELYMFINTKTGNHRWDNGISSAQHQETIVNERTALSIDSTGLLIDVAETMSSTHVHFNGLHDAVDRKRPIGSVGWNGLAYSPLSSLPMWATFNVQAGLSPYLAPRGLGAWHPFLRFNPYGKALQCHANNHMGKYAGTHIIKGNNGTSYTDASGAVITGTSNPTLTTAGAHETYQNGWSSASNFPKGTADGHFVVLTHESEASCIARTDLLKISGYGDRISAIWSQANVLQNGPPMAEAIGGRGGRGGGATSGFVPKTLKSFWIPSATTWIDKAIHNTSRYTAPANAGPYVEAQVFATLPAGGRYDATAATNNDAFGKMIQGDSCAAPTGDLFLSKAWQGVASGNHADPASIGGIREQTRPFHFSQDYAPLTTWHGSGESVSQGALNFTTDHIVWKRMDGGNLTMPAPNARGLGATPKTTRFAIDIPQGSGELLEAYRAQGSAVQTGETIYGNCRFSIETTNSAMLPVIQAQELAHPSLAEKYPHEIGDVLSIPNEDIQFESIVVIDDTGQKHTLEGGSPFGTVIRDFAPIANRDIGSAPSNVGETPNMQIQLPDANTIPGNIIVRSGFDNLQSYQNETIGTGGMHMPHLSEGYGAFNDGVAANDIPNVFTTLETDNGKSYSSGYPFWENHGYESINIENSSTANESVVYRTKPTFPFSAQNQFNKLTNDNPLKTSYELHDRTLYFHIVKNGKSYSKLESVYQGSKAPNDPFGAWVKEWAGSSPNNDWLGLAPVYKTNTGFVSKTTETIVMNQTMKEMWIDSDNQTKDGTGRYYFVATDADGNMHGGSYTGVSDSTSTFTHSIDTLTGVVFDADWPTTFTPVSIHRSWYTPAGSTRLFASRRMRDHAEVSGASPDMPLIPWWKLNSGASINPYEVIKQPRMTKMPIPRMGHHFITPTMAMMPGHLTHPLYQNIFAGHLACANATPSPESQIVDASISVPTMDPHIWFSNLTPNYPPSDIHGGSFTLMSETKVKYDGYGVLASQGPAGNMNASGGNLIVLETAKTYSLSNHFPDPLEVGAYQIIIQPNVFTQQITGFHQNSAIGTAAHATGASSQLNLTGQQVATVIGLNNDITTFGAIGLILADPVAADVRGCEVYLNEVILDIDPSPGQQFTTLPPLATFNPLGVNQSASPPFSRRSMPYHKTMFKRATPGYTLTIPWWSVPSIDYKNDLSLLNADSYYLFCRSTYGAISSQITLAGYPSLFYEPYTSELESLVPYCSVFQINQGAGTISVSVNNQLFPMVGTRKHLVAYDIEGGRHTATYTSRTINGDGTTPFAFNGVVGSALFWGAIDATSPTYGGGVLKLSGAYDTVKDGDVITDAKTSPFTRILPQILTGSRDTNNLFMADAYLCMWHHNLGRPMTALSEGRLDLLPTQQKPYNHMPDSFEMVHYHEFAYAISSGPFALNMKWFDMSTGNVSPDNEPIAPHADAGKNAGTMNGIPYFFLSYWPGGTRYGAGASRLDMWGDVERGWNSGQWYSGQCKTYSMTRDGGGAYSATNEMDIDTVVNSNPTGYDPAADLSWGRNNCFGYRFSIRQPYNRPRWAIAIKSLTDAAAGYSQATGHYGYFNGPYIQAEQRTTSANTAGFTSDNHQPYTGIIERMTNASALLGFDVPERQVRYSDGRRMTKPYGCPVRTLRNDATVRRIHPNDKLGKGITDLAQAVMYYIVDWWGNTTGEDVRRFPVRSFGVKPAFDPESWRTQLGYPPVLSDEFTTEGIYGQTPGTTPAWQLGSVHEINNNDMRQLSSQFADFFNPVDAIRVGDRGDGRGVRYPVPFNEYIVQSVDTQMNHIGMVLSFHTAEPPFTVGLLRSKDEPLTSKEPSRGISSKLGISDTDGLLKPAAMAGKNVESTSGIFGMYGLQWQDPVSRISPRIGIDALTVSEFTDSDPNNYIIQATQAVSMHSDKIVGQRFIFEGAHTLRGIPNYDAPAFEDPLDSAYFPQLRFRASGGKWEPAIFQFNNAHGLPSFGGNFIMDVSSLSTPFSDGGWGNHTASIAGVPYNLGTHGPTSNPYQSNTVLNVLDPAQKPTNTKDLSVKFLIRPVRMLDYKSMLLFRPHVQPPHGPQSAGDGNFFTATAGGRYGLFNYSTPNGRAATSGIYVSMENPSPTSAPFVASYIPDYTNWTDCKSAGPIIPKPDSTPNLKSTIARLLITENTLQHYRSDAPRRQTMIVESEDDEEDDDAVIAKNYAVSPRYSQTLHSKGEDGTHVQNTPYHANESNLANIRVVDW